MPDGFPSPSLFLKKKGLGEPLMRFRVGGLGLSSPSSSPCVRDKGAPHALALGLDGGARARGRGRVPLYLL